MPYVLTYCDLTNETFTSVMLENVCQVFYIVSYEVERLRKEREQLRAKHGV